MALGMGAIGGASTNALFTWMRECGECDRTLDHWNWLEVLGQLQAGTLVPEDFRGAREAIGHFFARRTAAELVAGALKRRILLTQVQTARTLAQSDHFRGRGAFERRGHRRHH